MYREARYFSASVLGAAQQSLSEHFARKGSGKWTGEPHTFGETGVPLLEGALVCFECEAHGGFDAGDHWIALGRVLGLGIAGEGEPLVFHRSRYACLAAAAEAVPDSGAYLGWGL